MVLKGLKDSNIKGLEGMSGVWWQTKKNNVVLAAQINYL